MSVSEIMGISTVGFVRLRRVVMLERKAPLQVVGPDMKNRGRITVSMVEVMGMILFFLLQESLRWFLTRWLLRNVLWSAGSIFMVSS